MLRRKAATPDYAELLGRVPAVLYIADVGGAGRWDYASPQIEAILGFTAEHWCDRPELWAQQLHPADRERVIATEASDAAGNPEPRATEYRMLHRDGSVVWIRDEAVLVSDPAGAVRWHGVLSDVTQRKLAEAELEQRAAQQAAVARLGEHALEGAATSELMQEALNAVAEILGVEVAELAELKPSDGSLTLRAGIGWPPAAIGTMQFAAGTGSQAGYTILTGGPVVVEDWQQEQRFAGSPLLRDSRARSGLCVPIEGRGGPFGVLGVQSGRPRHFRSGDVDFVHSLANVLADALERQSTEDAIRHRALHDALTGLPNRVLFLDRLEQALARLRRRRSLTAILFLDLDRFKLVNDSLGHQLGDELLSSIAPRLSHALRASDTVARFGGDEFGILLEDIASERGAIETAERIAEIFARPFLLAGREHFVTASIGIAFAQGGESAAELIRNGDAAMYRAKDRGRARYELFDDMMRERAAERLGMENDLRRALEREELRLEYQPVVSLRDGSVAAIEALLRWDHPERGPIPPQAFIPVAEENGLIEPIGRWVLERACREASGWCQARPGRPPVGISVNLSPLQLLKRNLPGLVADLIARSGIDPACLSLELTENVLLRDGDDLSDVLRELKATGVRLVLDDFGTGYSSLGYLTRLPLDALKIDRSFVAGLGTDPRSTAVSEAVIAMSQALSLEVIAEGVETDAQAAELLRLGCELGQGFRFSRPVDGAEITRLLTDRPRLPAAAARR